MASVDGVPHEGSRDSEATVKPPQPEELCELDEIQSFYGASSLGESQRFDRLDRNGPDDIEWEGQVLVGSRMLESGTSGSERGQWSIGHGYNIEQPHVEISGHQQAQALT